MSHTLQTSPSTTTRFWTESSDRIRIVRESCARAYDEVIRPSAPSDIKQIQIKIRGNPVALQRHRWTKTGRCYNPSLKAETLFRSAFKSRLGACSACQIEYPFFRKDEKVALTVIFYLKRPKAHFKGSKSGPGHLRARCSLLRDGKMGGDIDNFVKFFMDALNGVAYADDSQIISLKAVKVYQVDDTDIFGATEIHLEKTEEPDVLKMLEQIRR